MEYRHVARAGLEAARSFQDRHVKDYHKAFREPATWDAQRAKYSSKDVTTRDRLDTATSDFQEAIAIYQQAMPKFQSGKTQLLPHVDVAQAHSWDEVVRAAKFAEDEYAKAAGGAIGVPRRFGRVLGDRSEAIVPWLELLPNSTYCSIVCGALKLIFGAAAFRKEMRVHILEAFRDLPCTIQDAQNRRGNFVDDSTLHDLTIELYLNILSASRSMIQWLVDKDALDRLKAFVGGSTKERLVEDELKKIGACITAIKTRVEMLRDKLIVSTEREIRIIAPKVDVLDDRTKLLETGIQFISVTANEIDAALGCVAEKLEGKRSVDDERFLISTSSMMQISAKIEALENAVEAKNNLLELFINQCMQANWYQAQASKQHYEHHAKAMISSATLAGFLGTSPDLCTRDVKTINAHGHQIGGAMQNSAYALLRSPKYQNWLHTNSSRLLLVNGSYLNLATASISPLSVLCGLLLEGLGQIAPANIICHFCGLHTRSNDDVCGPQGIVRSLITQLLALYEFELDFMNRAWKDGIEQRDLPTLCNLFSRLVQDLPTNFVIFCIVDNISVFEGYKWYDEMTFVLCHLDHVAKDQGNRAVFKALITSPGSSRLGWEQLDREDQFTIPRDAGGLGERLTAAQVQQASQQHRHSSRGSQSTKFATYNACGGSADPLCDEEVVDFEQENE